MKGRNEIINERKFVIKNYKHTYLANKKSTNTYF